MRKNNQSFNLSIFQSFNRDSAFTLVELLISIGVIAALTSIGTLYLVNYRSSQTLNLEAQKIVATLRDAQSRAIAQENARPWGVHFENPQNNSDFYSLFASSTYNSADIISTTTLNEAVVFLAPADQQSKNIVFSAITGLPQAADYITIALKANTSASSTIYIYANGKIEGGKAAALDQQPSSPFLTTQTATNIGVNSATLNGLITNEGSASVTIVGFDYGQTTSYGSQTTSNWAGGVGSFSLGISGLSSNTTYHFRAKAKNSAGWGYGSDTTFTTSAALSTPYVWVTNAVSHSVTKLNSTDGSTIGTYSVGNIPWGVAVDASGNVWVTNYSSSDSVTKLSSTGSTIGTYSVGIYPYGIAVDASGNVWVANTGSDSVTKLSSTGSTIGTYSVGAWPSGIAVDSSGNVWVANTGSNSVTKLNSSGSTIGTYSVGSNPCSVAIDASRNVWVTNWSSNSVTKLDSTGSIIGTYSVGSSPVGIAVDASGNVWVANWSSNSVTKLDSTGSIIGTYSVGSGPQGIAVDASGNVWVTNENDNSVTKLDSTGSIIGTYSVGSGPLGVSIDASGNVWVANTYSNSVTKLSSTGSTIGTYSVGNNPYAFGDATGFALQYFVLGRR